MNNNTLINNYGNIYYYIMLNINFKVSQEKDRYNAKKINRNSLLNYYD